MGLVDAFKAATPEPLDVLICMAGCFYPGPYQVCEADQRDGQAHFFSFCLSLSLTHTDRHTQVHTHPQTTPDGIEQTLQINFYAHALLTLGLLDRLRARPGSRTIMVRKFSQESESVMSKHSMCLGEHLRKFMHAQRNTAE